MADNEKDSERSGGNCHHLFNDPGDGIVCVNCGEDYVTYLVSRNASLLSAVKELRGALEKARDELQEAGHASSYDGIAVKCPNCVLCEIEMALAKAKGVRP